MRRLKTAFAALILILLSVMGYQLYRNAEIIARREATGTLLNPKAELSLERPHFVEMDGERKVLEIDAERAYYFNDEERVELERPSAVFYGKGGGTTYVTGRTGVMEEAGGYVEIRDDVRVDFPDGYRLKTSSIRYDGGEMTVSTDDRIWVTGDGIEVTGIGMRMDLEGRKIVILSEVDAVLERSFMFHPAGAKDEG